jgi:DNA-binding XRE family transcriptional regulator
MQQRRSRPPRYKMTKRPDGMLPPQLIYRRCMLAAIDAGLSQAEIARRIGVPPSRVNDVFRGWYYRAPLLIDVAAELGTTTRDLFGLEFAREAVNG